MKELDDKIAQALDLLRKRRLGEFEVYGSSTDTIRAESKEGAMGSLIKSRETGISVRVLIDDSMGFAYGSQANAELIDAAVTSARHQFKDPNNRLPQAQEGYPGMDIFDRAVEGATAEDCIAQAITLEQSARDADLRVNQVRKASFSRTVSNIRIVNSHGVDSAAAFTFASSSIMVTARQGDDTQSGYEFDLNHFLGDIDVKKIGTQAVKRATDMLMAQKIRTMKLPVLFDNTTTSEILEFISDALVGENILKGKSFLKDKLGKAYFSSSLTLADNPLDPRAADACPFDGEGVPSRKNVLVQDGSIAAFVYDSYWGNAAGKGSTGNSLRGGYRSPPTSGIRHLCLEPGEQSMADRLKGIKQVLKITDIMGMHTANPITGEFSVGINGILLEDGLPARPVREAAISGNMYELFSRVVAVGTDVREFGHVLCPSLLIESIDVSAQ